MRPRLSITEVAFGIFVVLLLAILLLPRIVHLHNNNGIINCLMNVRQIDDAFIVWAGDHNGNFPMEMSITNGGAMELVTTGNVAACFMAMSYQLSSPRLLICPNDLTHTAATNFQNDFNDSHISYFVALDAGPNSLQRFLCGDSNFASNGVPVNSGILELSSSSPVAWIPNRHPNGGTVGFADGHAEEMNNSALPTMFQQTGLANNRLAIP